ncbi:MAG: hypothetical protein ACRD3B_16930, partial [Candidatus Sulfotelmatobacter sp.]
IWPLLSRLLEHQENLRIDRVLKGQLVGYYPFSLVERGQTSIGDLVASLHLSHQLIGVGLLLVAVIYLSKTKSNNRGLRAS